jgi:hypothetical protein
MAALGTKTSGYKPKPENVDKLKQFLKKQDKK